jgi:hypothetical protein
MQRQLLGQRVTQFGVVVDDKNFTRVRHQSGISAAAWRPVNDAAFASPRLFTKACDFVAPSGAK